MGNTLSESDRRIIARVEGNDQSLVRVELTSEHINEEGCRWIAKALRRNTAVKQLKLCFNDIGSDGARAFMAADGLAHATALTHLHLYGNGIGPEGARAVTESILLNHGSRLSHLNLGGNGIGIEGAEHLARALGGRRDDTGGGGGVRNVATLRHLYLVDNDIGPEGAGALAYALRTNSSLTDLDLGRNGLGSGGVGTLMSALARSGSNSSLTHLYLGGNEVGDDGAVVLANGLARNRGLRHVCLKSNGIGDEGAEALARSLLENKNLTRLDLMGNGNIGYGGIRAFEIALRRNHTVLYINLDLIRGDQGGIQQQDRGDSDGKRYTEDAAIGAIVCLLNINAASADAAVKIKTKAAEFGVCDAES